MLDGKIIFEKMVDDFIRYYPGRVSDDVLKQTVTECVSEGK